MRDGFLPVFSHPLVAYSTVFRLKVVELLCEIVLASDNDILVCLQTGTGRNKVSADNVFLKSFKMIDSSSDGCLAENLGGLLEGSCGDKAVCLECGSGDTLKDEFCSSRSCRL